MKKRLWAICSGSIFSMLCFLLLTVSVKASATYHELPIDGQWMQQGTITEEYDMRYYKITLPQAGYLTIDVRSLANGFQYRLLDENYNVFAQIDQVIWGASESEPKGESWSRWLEAGTYYMRVCKYGSEAIGNFWLRASFRSAGNQEREPNQTYENPVALDFGKEIRGLLSVQDKNDYYALKVTKSQKYTLGLKCYFSGIRVRLMNSDLKELSNDVVWNGTEALPKVYEKDFDLTPGTYYIHLDVYSSSIYDKGLYDLKVTPAKVSVSNLLLNKTSLQLYKGDTASLQVTVSPTNATDKTVTWVSSNSSVASVDANGKIHGKSAGTAIVKVSSNDGSGITQSCEVVVKEKTLAVTEKNVTLYKGKSKTLKVTVSPKVNVSFTSSNSKIASVSSKGKITAKKKGTCKIFVKAHGYTRKVTVVVKNPELKVGKTTVNLKKGKTYTIKATTKPKTKITYRSSNSNVASVSSKGKIKAKKKGTCKVYVTANGLKKTIKVKVRSS